MLICDLSAITALLASSNIDKGISELMVVVEAIIDAQIRTANKLFSIPRSIQDEINSGYAGLEMTVKEIRPALVRWRCPFE